MTSPQLQELLRKTRGATMAKAAMLGASFDARGRVGVETIRSEISSEFPGTLDRFEGLGQSLWVADTPYDPTNNECAGCMFLGTNYPPARIGGAVFDLGQNPPG